MDAAAYWSRYSNGLDVGGNAVISMGTGTGSITLTSGVTTGSFTLDASRRC